MNVYKVVDTATGDTAVRWDDAVKKIIPGIRAQAEHAVQQIVDSKKRNNLSGRDVFVVRVTKSGDLEIKKWGWLFNSSIKELLARTNSEFKARIDNFVGDHVPKLWRLLSGAGHDLP